jgi:tetratricopeptide (TPR) repeat protein
MQAIAARADQCNRRGFELASKGAFYSARAEFVKALRLLAQSLDAEAETPRHGDALVNGLLALEESDDFLDRGLPVDHRIDVAGIVATHRTVVLKENNAKGLTPLAALTRYYAFAQEQLAAAVDQEPTGSVALYGLGKVYSTLAAADAVATVAGGPKAIAMHQAALAVDPKNALAAHELGVLLARCGQFEGAREALSHSANHASRPETWRNLAVVLEQLGDRVAAAQARQQAAVVAGQAVRMTSGTGSPQQPLIWMEPGQFATTSAPQAEASVGARSVGPTSTAPSSGAPSSGQKSAFGWPIRMGAK